MGADGSINGCKPRDLHDKYYESPTGKVIVRGIENVRMGADHLLTTAPENDAPQAFRRGRKGR